MALGSLAFFSVSHAVDSILHMLRASNCSVVGASDVIYSEHHLFSGGSDISQIAITQTHSPYKNSDENAGSGPSENSWQRNPSVASVFCWGISGVLWDSVGEGSSKSVSSTHQTLPEVSFFLVG